MPVRPRATTVPAVQPPRTGRPGPPVTWKPCGSGCHSTGCSHARGPALPRPTALARTGPRACPLPPPSGPGPASSAAPLPAPPASRRTWQDRSRTAGPREGVATGGVYRRRGGRHARGAAGAAPPRPRQLHVAAVAAGRGGGRARDAARGPAKGPGGGDACSHAAPALRPGTRHRPVYRVQPGTEAPSGGHPAVPVPHCRLKSQDQ